MKAVIADGLLAARCDVVDDGGEKVGKLQGFFVFGFDDKLTRWIHVSITTPKSFFRTQIYPRIGLGKAGSRKNEGKGKKSHPDCWAPTICFSGDVHELFILSVELLPSR